MNVYKIIDGKGKFIKTYSNRKIWEKLNWLKASINYHHKYDNDTRLEKATIIKYELKEVSRQSVSDYMKGVL
jgi:hypothetical protein